MVAYSAYGGTTTTIISKLVLIANGDKLFQNVQDNGIPPRLQIWGYFLHIFIYLLQSYE